ncbi:5422_t:CDS:1, partial [Gigaspora rosea]
TYISPKFKNGGVVEDMILDLVSGKIKIGNIPLIEVCILDNKIHSSDNRRLYAIQSAIKLGAKIKKIPVRIVRKEDCNIEWKYFGSKKLVIENTNFLNVVVNEKYAKNGLL